MELQFEPEEKIRTQVCQEEYISLSSFQSPSQKVEVESNDVKGAAVAAAAHRASETAEHETAAEVLPARVASEWDTASPVDVKKETGAVDSDAQAAAADPGNCDDNGPSARSPTSGVDERRYQGFQVHATSSGRLHYASGDQVLMRPSASTESTKKSPARKTRTLTTLETEELRYREMCRKAGFPYVSPPKTESRLQREARRWNLKRGCEKACKSKKKSSLKVKEFSSRR